MSHQRVFVLVASLLGGVALRAGAATVVVLPFDDLSAEASARWLERGMAAQIAADLAFAPEHGVTPRVQTNQLAQALRRIHSRPKWSEVREEMTRRFRADWCVGGEFKREGARLELRAWMARKGSAPQELATLDVPWSEALTAQDEVAVRALRAMGFIAPDAMRQRMAAEPTASVAAYEQFLRGLDAWDAEENPRGDRAQARAHYESALRLDQQFAKARNNLGVVFEHEGKLDEAEREYRRALELMPLDAAPRLNLANVFMKRGLLSDALEACAAAKRADPLSLRARLKAGLLHQRNGRVDYAEAEYRNALHADPECAMAHVNLGVVLFNANRTTVAGDHFRRAIESGNDAVALAYAHNNLGNVHRRAKQWDDALAEYAEALRWKDDYALAALNLGDAHLQKGNRDQAAHWYEEALRLDPTLDAAKKKLDALRK